MVPFRYTLYPTTPTLSVEAVQEREMLDAVIVPTVSPVVIDGEMASVTGFEIVTVTLAELPTFPAASEAFASNTCVPFVMLQVLSEKVYGEVVSVPASVQSK